MQKAIKLLKASAGSGKTFNLTLQYLILLFSGNKKFEKILAVTFTNKATEEMKDRILSTLVLLAKEPENPAVAPYKERILIALSPLKEADIQKQATQIYREIIHNYSRFAVSTIDGFVQKVIRSFSFELGLESGFTLEMNIEKVKEDLIKRLDDKIIEKPALLQIMLALIKNQIQSGKSWKVTRLINDYTDELFKERFSLFENALLKFDSEEELYQVLEDYSKKSTRLIDVFELQMLEYSTQMEDLMQNHGVRREHLKGLKSSPFISKIDKLELVESADRFKKLLLPDADWFQKKVSFPEFESEMNALLKTYLSYFDKYSAGYELGKIIYNSFNIIALLKEMTFILQEYRTETGHILISDSQKLIAGIAGEGANPSFIWEKIGAHFKHFLFDEFQDTSQKQWDTFKPLLENILSETPENVNISQHFIVGDEKQAIYRWRNGDWRILHSEVEKNFPQHILSDSLLENRRSAKNIIQFNNHLFQYLPKILQETIAVPEPLLEWWKEIGAHDIIEKVYQNVQQEVIKEDPEGCLKISTFFKTKNTLPNEEEDNTDLSESQEIIIDEIKVLLAHHYALSEICVLVRNNADAVNMVEALLKNKIKVISGEALLLANNTAVKVLVNCLKVLFSGTDNQKLVLAQLIYFYQSNQNPASAKMLHENDWLLIAQKPIQELSALLPNKFCKQYTLWQQMPSMFLVQEIIDTFELNTSANELYLLSFKDELAKFFQYSDLGIPAFLDWWESEGIKKTLPALNKIDAVQVCTIHKSKGLAFRAVFLVNCDWSLTPRANAIHIASMENTPFDKIEIIPFKFNKSLKESSIPKVYYEEAILNLMDAINLLYVASTRAIDYLHLIINTKKGLNKISDLTKIGHGILYTLNNYPFEGSTFSENCTYFQWGAIPEKQMNDAPLSIEKPLINNKGPHQLQNLMTKVQKPRKIQKVFESAEMREGNIMHEILSKCSKLASIEPYIRSIQATYNLTEEEIKQFKKQTEEILTHPELTKLYNDKDAIVSEKNIYTLEGKIIRPDKLFINDQKVVLLDYKFSQKEEKEHLKQILNYKSQLQLMGFTEIKAYLFYYKSQTLKSV